MEDVTIESLIAQKRVVTTADLTSPTSDYMVVGVYQNGTNKSKGDGTSYKNYVISIAELLGGGSAYTGDGTTIVLNPGNIFGFASMNISQFINNSGYTTAAAIAGLAWIPNGNTFGVEKYIGTNDNFDLPIVTNSNVVARFSNTGVFTSYSADGDFVVGAVDAFARRQVWVKYLNGLLRMGSDVADGDPSNIDSEGIVIFHPSDDRASSIKADRFGLTTALDTSLYYFRADPTALFYKDASLNTIFRADRATTNVGIGTASPTARLHVQGADVTAVNFALKLENSAVNLYSVSNSGINTWNTYSDGIGSGTANFSYSTSVGGILNEYTSVDGFKMSFIESAVVKGAFVNTSGFCQLHAQHRFTLKDNGNISKLWMDSINGYIGIGATYFAADSQLHVQGQDATAANYAMKIQNSAGTALLYARNDGRISMPNVQTGNAGLITGDLYVDTAANILANGDVVVGRKV